MIYIGNFLESVINISSLLFNQHEEISPTSTLTPTPIYIQHPVTPASPSSLSTIRPATQPITVVNAGSVAQVRWARIFGSPVNLALSPDGKTLAVATSFNIRIYDPGNLETPLFELEGQNMLSRVMFSPDGQILASGSSFDGTIWLWDMPVGGVKREVLKGQAEAIDSIAFNPNGELLASGGGDKSICLWDVNPVSPSFGKELFALQRHSDWVDSLVFSHDRMTLISASKRDGTIRIWEVGPES